MRSPFLLWAGGGIKYEYKVPKEKCTILIGQLKRNFLVRSYICMPKIVRIFIYNARNVLDYLQLQIKGRFWKKKVEIINTIYIIIYNTFSFPQTDGGYHYWWWDDMISKFGNGVVIKRYYPTDGYHTTTTATTTTTTTTATTTPRPSTTTTKSRTVSKIVPHRITPHHASFSPSKLLIQFLRKKI